MATISPFPIRKSARERLDEALTRIAEPEGEGARAYLTVYADTARAEADAADRRAAEGRRLGALDGAIVSIKDLFDVAGEPTRAGSKVLADAPPAVADAPVVGRLRSAGAVVIGKTNMSEFAFSGVGANAHYGTPGNPADRARIPGGSSSGGAVAAADGMCEIAIGTDTGGSTRIPAALCGIVGFKPTKARVPTDGSYPLSPTLDSVGPMARSVAACAAADGVIAGDEPWSPELAPINGLRFGILEGIPLDELDQTVAAAFQRATQDLAKAGARLSPARLSPLEDMARVSVVAPLPVAEAYQIHKDKLATRAADYDPFILRRIESGSAASPADIAQMLAERRELIRGLDLAMAEFDALLLPTTPIVAPTKGEVSTPGGFNAANRLLLRNTAIANFFDLCAISLPIPTDGLPVGLMLFARNGHDRRLFEMATAIEPLFARG